ncbi:MAG: dipeptidase [Candidatus Limnocylindrales bacterium]
MISRLTDRALHGVALHGPGEIRPDALAFHSRIPVVDLLVGTVLFRRRFLSRGAVGHVDLPRAQDGGLDLLGLSIATRFPDLRGSLSGPHFRSLGLPMRALPTNMELAEALMRRVENWAVASGGRLELVRSRARLTGFPRPDGRVGAFIGVQGGHVLDGDPANVTLLRSLGVRMLAPAHVMDNELVGSNTGLRRGGLTPLGREVIDELQRSGIVVDLAHMASTGIRDALPLLRQPFVVSHTGLAAFHGRRSRLRRYSAANRNLTSEDARLLADAGGLIGLTLSTSLLGGDTLGRVVDAFRYTVDLVGVRQVALGSDFDGGLRTVFDVTGLPRLTQGLLDGGFSPDEIAAVMGGNALRVLAAGA